MGSTTQWAHADWLNELRRRFGEDPMNWAFVCPQCSTVITGTRLKAGLTAHPRTRKDGAVVITSDLLGRECIGRTDPSQGCNWAAYGLFRGPEFVVMPDGRKAPCFAMAEPEKT